MKNLKLLAVLLLAVVVMQGCESASSNAEEAEPVEGPVVYNPNAATYIASVQQFVDAMLAGDSATLADLTTDDFLGIYVTNPLDTMTKENFIKDWVTFQTTRSNQQNERVAASALKVNEGDYVGDWVQYWGNYSATLIEADTSILIPYFVNIQMSEGKISRMFSYYDRVPVWRAVGYQMIPPGQ